MRLTALTYTYVEDMLERRDPHRADHLALIERFSDQGRLLIAGAVGESAGAGLLVFSDDQAAAEFVAADPYGEAGLISSHEIQPWNVVAHRPLPQ
ncbi:MAG: YciI family protein [Solirubrobacterales bacterium]